MVDAAACDLWMLGPEVPQVIPVASPSCWTTRNMRNPRLGPAPKVASCHPRLVDRLNGRLADRLTAVPAHSELVALPEHIEDPKDKDPAVPRVLSAGAPPMQN